MTRTHLLAVLMLSTASTATAQNPDCRQSWMPADAPAFCSWENEPALPEARTYQAVATSGNSIYVLGGFRFDASNNQVVYYNSVLRSTINADGHLSQWAAETAFTSARSGAAGVAVGDCLFLGGGSSSTTTSLTLSFAKTVADRGRPSPGDAATDTIRQHSTDAHPAAARRTHIEVISSVLRSVDRARHAARRS